LVEEAIKNKISINKNLITYPVLNNNIQLLLELDKKQLVDWYNELYYSALLSGSMEMVKFIESKIPDIHKNYVLDTSKNKKGQMSLLLMEMIYEINKKKYFSHTINYAIQSGSLEIVKYIHQKGYGITVSNFITAIKQSTLDILNYLCENYFKKLPFYLIHYFGTNSYISNKIEKAKILIFADLLPLDQVGKLSIDDYRKESTHIEMISQTVQVPEDGNIDTDYLMKYQLFFVPIKGFKLNYRLITKTRICLKLNLENELKNIFLSNLNQNDRQFVIDVLYLFGTIDQIKKLYPLLNTNICPSKQIIMEIMCYCQINKLCHLSHNNLLTDQIVLDVYPIATMLGDHCLNLFFQKIVNDRPKIKFILLSGKKSEIEKWLIENKPIQKSWIDKDIIKNILALEDLNLIIKIDIPHELLFDLICWAEESDLLEIQTYLKSINIMTENN
jgi:hypothetical protein